MWPGMFVRLLPLRLPGIPGIPIPVITLLLCSPEIFDRPSPFRWGGWWRPLDLIT